MTDNVLVLGAASFIGIHLIKKLISMDCQITAVCRPNSEKNKILYEQFGKAIQYIELDVCSVETDLSALEKSSHFDWIYIAAWNGSKRGLRNSTEVNMSSADGLLNCLEVILQNNDCRGVIFLGSQAEYGDLRGIVSEESVSRCYSAYGKAKLFFGTKASKICEENHIPLFWFRLHSIFGSGMNDGILKELVLKLLRNEECIMFTDCMQKGDYLYIDDCINALVIPMCQKIDAGIYNISAGEGRSLYSYFESIKDIVNPKGIIRYGTVHDGMSADFLFSSDKIRKTSGWNPMYTFEEGTHQMLLEWKN